ncbi:MAG TPA: insulinase family protein, partial [Methylomirabilota bacterium]|nr:insulinase family protein [Methylomirabilota bacterium]
MTAPARMTRFHPVATVRSGILALSLSLAAWPLSAAAVEVERVVSPGGIEAWLVSDDTVPLIAMDFAFRGGASQEPAEKAGLSQLTTGLLDEGAGDLDADAFKRRLETAAVRLSFGAGRDELSGSLATLADRRDEAVDLLALALT